MERNIGKLNIFIALFALVAVVVNFYTQFMGIFDSAKLDDQALSISGILFAICGLVGVAALMWVLIVAVLDASKGKRMNVKVPLYGFAIYGMSVLVKYLVCMQATNVWSNPSMWVGVILGLFILGAALFAVLFEGRALNIMGFVISGVLVGYFGFFAMRALIAPADFTSVFVYVVLATLFVATALAYVKQISAASEEKAATVKKVEKK